MKETTKTTENRSVYNKLRKRELENYGSIHCCWCNYHWGENYKGKSYGGFVDKQITYPNWKLVFKNKKQWMNKRLKITFIEDKWRSGEYIEIKF